ncbi:MAG: twin transmembrane helix small protein [Alcanivoracaceae bacterium]|nr:twin transmembrane helix small protein [Alcanivoracaceae bacterium]
MWVKIIALLLLAAAVVSLFHALTSMMKNESAGGKTVRALAWRVAFSVLVFLFLLLSMYMGWVTPHGVNPVQAPAQQEAGAGQQDSPADAPAQ